ncbi:MAG: agmatinase family protein [Planctomycetes bacterium]|nr:agmatinase family protein [Planctomycetota bacterium]
MTPVNTTFDPDAAAPADAGLFGLPADPENAVVHVVPVPFDATTSYRKGTARGPEAILRASLQVDLFDVMTGTPWSKGICMLDPNAKIAKLNAKATKKADRIIELGGRIGKNKELAKDLALVNAIGAEVNAIVREQVDRILDAGKLPCVVGGDHSTPFGGIQACSERFPNFGILHFDAHADLREAYEGFEWSHASIMHNVVTKLPKVSKLVQVGIRDLGEREHALIASPKGKIHTLFDVDWGRAKADGTNLRHMVRKTIQQLPDHVWVSFDVDGLDPTLCPNTGTPVPGGLSWHDAMLWLEELSRSSRRVVGLDLNEVSPGDAPDDVDSWDAIVGARLLYRLIGTALLTR